MNHLDGISFDIDNAATTNFDILNVNFTEFYSNHYLAQKFCEINLLGNPNIQTYLK